MAIKKAGNVLDALFDLRTGDTDAAEKIWRAVSQRMQETESPVDLSFYQWDHEQTEQGPITITYDPWTFESDADALQKVKDDCAALKQLGFHELQRHAS